MAYKGILKNFFVQSHNGFCQVGRIGYPKVIHVHRIVNGFK
jgi:hypothetical protein